MSYLLDTDVLSEARKPRGDRGVKKWMAAVPGGELYVSVLVMGEIRQGVERLRRRDPVAAATFDAWLGNLHAEYRERILGVTAEVADAWGVMNIPDALPAIDGLLAATAKVHGLTLVTRNTSDVYRTGVAVHNPFSGKA